MNKTLLLLLMIASTTLMASSEKIEAKKSLQALISPFLQKKNANTKFDLKEFSVAGCEKHKINWMNVLFMREAVALKFKFAKGCDIEGIIYPAVLKPFSADLKLKNLENFNRLRSENKITSTIESQPILSIEVREAKLTGPKGDVLFEADYQVKIDPLKKDDPVAENLGGEIRITEIYGKKVSIKERVKIE